MKDPRGTSTNWPKEATFTKGEDTMAAQWTFMVYMAGNNSLSDAADDDLAEMRKVGSTADVQVLAFVAQSRLSGTAQRLKVEKNGHGEKAETLNDVDSGDPQTVIDFIRWGIKKAPAQKYAIILWNHGGGWRPDDLNQLYKEVRQARGEPVEQRAASREMEQRAAVKPLARTFFSRSLKKILQLPTAEDRAICYDDGSGHSLDTLELGGVLKLVKEEIGHKVDLLGMDACLMSCLEVAYEVKDQAGVVVGSEEPEPGAGWDYSTLLRDLTAKSTMGGMELGQRTVARYIESYQNQPSQWPVTQSAVDTSRIDEPCQALDNLEQSLKSQLGVNWPQVLKAQRYSVTLGPPSFRLVDLASLCENLMAAPLSAGVQSAAQAVVDALRPGGYIIAEGHLGPRVQGCGGASVYMPLPTDDVSRYYNDLAFAKGHRWGQFLQEYHASV